MGCRYTEARRKAGSVRLFVRFMGYPAGQDTDQITDLLGLVYFPPIFSLKRTSPIILASKDAEICRNLLFTQYSPFFLNILSQKYSIIIFFYFNQRHTSMEKICGDISELSPSNSGI
jgi:hypothetical protein